ncbi:MAG TPA: hypothetical protein VL426_01255 [Candidatus Binatia bacterium]|jgi:hypothetical protein|nr:hypothetical protein [Candidatus Binatia bacterium]
MSKRTIPAFAVLAATLALAGFGCRPILDQQVERQQTLEAKRQDDLWIIEDPVLHFDNTPSGAGTATLDFKTQPGSTVTVTLEGPGVERDATQTLPVDENGSVQFLWRLIRLGRYTFKGQVIFNGVVVDSFDGSGDDY